MHESNSHPSTLPIPPAPPAVNVFAGVVLANFAGLADDVVCYTTRFTEARRDLAALVVSAYVAEVPRCGY